MSTPLLVDDCHPAVDYSPNVSAWELNIGHASAVNKTLHGTNTTGSGVSIAYWSAGLHDAWTSSAGPSYTIDGVPIATVTTPSSGSWTDFNYMTFSKRDPPPGPHVLTISRLNRTFWLEYFLVDGSLIINGSASIIPFPSPSFSLPSASAPPPAKHTLSIVVGTVGGVLFFLLAMLCICLLLRRRRRQKHRAYSRHVQPILPPVGRSLPRTSTTSSLEKASIAIDTAGVTECTAPTSADCEVSAPAAHFTVAAPQYRRDTRPAPLKQSSLAFIRTPSRIAAEEQFRVAVRPTPGIPSGRDNVGSMRADAAAGSPETPLALPHDVEYALSGASPAEVQSGVIHILRSLLARQPSQALGSVPGRTEVDSGVRIVEDALANLARIGHFFDGRQEELGRDDPSSLPTSKSSMALVNQVT
ncbi:hypothetical protein C8T65DRAFT_745500 [Cerioporus squamosus]|nr:hypothetical protein C8T65DRAFT_745500 [Cerioporus squamosus]